MSKEVPKLKLKQKDIECITHCDRGKLICPESVESQNTFKRAGELRNHEVIHIIEEKTREKSSFYKERPRRIYWRQRRVPIKCKQYRAIIHHQEFHSRLFSLQ